MLRYTILCFLFILYFPIGTFAWGRKGHHIVAAIAMQHLDDATKQKVTELLGTTSPDDASTWMDDMRSRHTYNFMRTWHYIDFPKGTPYPAATEENAVTEMTAAWLELKHCQSLTPDQAKIDVMVLFHLTGDLHQPLHTGYAEDRGGNNIQVRFNGKSTNLHAVWDEGLIEQQDISLTEVEALHASIPADEAKRIGTVDIVGWMNESRMLLPQVYDFSGHKLPESYGLKNKAVIEKQLLYAGIRLAALLESALDAYEKRRPSAPLQQADQ